MEIKKREKKVGSFAKKGMAPVLAALMLLAAGCSSNSGEASTAPVSEAPVSQAEASSQEEAPSQEPESSEAASSEVQSIPEIPEDPAAEPYLNEGIVMYGKMALEAFYDCQEQAADYAEVISTIKRAVPSAEVYNIVVPTHVEFALPEKYKADFSVSERPTLDAVYNNYSAEVKGVDVYDALSLHKLEYLYFNTDHHWTGLGAYYAYTKFAEEAGFTPVAQEDMEKKSIPGLLGLLYDITQEPVLEQNPDSVEYFTIPGDYECQVMYQGSDEWLETSMLAEYAEGANAYGVFLGGDNKLFKIQNQDPTMKNGKKIAVLKESFGNAFVPFLSPHYSEVHVLDMRYWEGNLASYAAENGIDEILIMNNIKSACNYTFHDYLLAMT